MTYVYVYESDCGIDAVVIKDYKVVNVIGGLETLTDFHGKYFIREAMNSFEGWDAYDPAAYNGQSMNAVAYDLRRKSKDESCYDIDLIAEFRIESASNNAVTLYPAKMGYAGRVLFDLEFYNE